MLNTSKIEQLIKERKITKIKLCSKVGIARTTLDAILNGGDTQVSTLEAIASALDKPVGYFFHDDNIKIITSEGDFSPVSASGDVTVSVGDAVLTERVKALETLLAEKNERIAELKERIGELKGR